MAGPSNKRRPVDGRLQRPSKKQKRRAEYNSDSESERVQDFDAVNLLDSDDDILNAEADEAADANEDASSSSGDDALRSRKAAKLKGASKSVRSQPRSEPDDEGGEDEDEEEEDEEDESGSDSEEAVGSKPKSKRNDPSAFANSLSKILSTKLSTSKRSDPVLARSAAAHEASKAAVDSALEAKARRHLKEQKRKALERGRVKDVLSATKDAAGGPDASTAGVLEVERKLREVAKRGVIKMFNAVRAAQVKAAEAERDARKGGVIGMNRREEKVNELSKQGFLELLASGGGGLKRGALEEA
ncbi:hypothetical protein CDD83_9141 [Cordyceps sp. RAO-2017]|nr:hypothetical protein CDD83_9141 [Cordyceps sp. RAO-2017]